ncbi:hypothetical protein IAT38_001895 [Cryptococcus sp. DSM 104549]
MPSRPTTPGHKTPQGRQSKGKRQDKTTRRDHHEVRTPLLGSSSESLGTTSTSSGARGRHEHIDGYGPSSGHGPSRSTPRRYGPSATTIPSGPGPYTTPSRARHDSSKSKGGQGHGRSAAVRTGIAAGAGGKGGQGISSPPGWGWADGDPEDDDFVHNPDPRGYGLHNRGTIFTARGFVNIGCLIIIALAFVTLFAGYPIISFYQRPTMNTNGAFNLGGINGSGQVPMISNFPTPIDRDTPEDKYQRTGFDGEEYNLVFSDEFEKEGRTFFPGDDPFWTAVDIHYWPTGDFEWYDPSAITTRDGKLVITMTQEPIHDLNFKSGMLQSWNQMCFQYSVYIEVTVSLPGNNKVGGFWPGVWMMGNLGRPGYGATTEGTWPYTYDSCDIGTLKNQTEADGQGPEAALTSGPEGAPISYLPGQKMSACTCPGEDHAGPDVTYGRGVPEIDIIEGEIDLSVHRGRVSQSCQVAPFDEGYQYLNSSKAAVLYDSGKTEWNAYKGGPYQEAVSMTTLVDNADYVGNSNKFGVFSFEYYTDPNDRESGHITWVSDGEKSWTMYPAAVGPMESMGIGQRLISEEPMAMILNLGMSDGFQRVDFANLETPAEMQIDYVRVYQRSEGRMGCDPEDRPTKAYIDAHMNAYTNPNLTTWEAAGYAFPKNSLIDTC